MSTNYHTDVATGAAANASTFNTPLGALDQAITNLSGGSLVTSAVLKEWAQAEAFEMTSITYHGTYTGVVSTATVKWPDGSAGTFTATTINSAWEAVDAYTVTHASSGKTVTQAAVTRNASGRVTSKPALTVA